MVNKGTRLYSILHHKCPRCHEGNLYTHGAYRLSHFSDMPEHCKHCEVYLACMIGASVILFPVTLRVSRAIYINFFVSYQKPEERNQLNNYHAHTNNTSVSQTLHGNIHE